MDAEPTQSGLSRRSMIKRSAVVGGTLVWATPVVQTIASNQFALAGSGGTTTGGTGSNISWVAVVAKCGSTYCTGVLSVGGTSLTYGAPPNGGDNTEAYDAWLSLVGGTVPAASASCTGIFSAPVITDSGDKVAISLAPGAECVIIGWVVHDGGCSSVTGTTVHAYSSDVFTSNNHTESAPLVDGDSVAVGTSIPTPSASTTTSIWVRKPCSSATAG